MGLGEEIRGHGPYGAIRMSATLIAPYRIPSRFQIHKFTNKFLCALVAAIVFGFGLAPAHGQPRPVAFDLEALPQGKSVTIPRPATTWVPLTMRARLTATDMPQSLSLRLIGPGPGKIADNPVKLAIYDPNSERVVYATVRPGVSFVYNFRDLRPIMVVSEESGGALKQVKLQVESNKPLEISH